jgi:hypothetical protein
LAGAGRLGAAAALLKALPPFVTGQCLVAADAVVLAATAVSSSRGGRRRHRYGIAAAGGGAAIDGEYAAKYIPMYRNLCRGPVLLGFPSEAVHAA